MLKIFNYLLILPINRKINFRKLIKNYKKQNNQKNDYIDGDFEDIEDDNDRKV